MHSCKRAVMCFRLLKGVCLYGEFVVGLSVGVGGVMCISGTCVLFVTLMSSCMALGGSMSMDSHAGAYKSSCVTDISVSGCNPVCVGTVSVNASVVRKGRNLIRCSIWV